jgi:hypothetical protein
LTTPATVAWAKTTLGQATAIARSVTTLKQLRIALSLISLHGYRDGADVMVGKKSTPVRPDPP